MDILLKIWAVVLFLAGVPFFLGLATMLGTLASMDTPKNHEDIIPKFFMCYIACAVAGLLTAAGGMLWAVAKLAYPLKERTKASSKES
jgi:hypothetical protein